MTQIIDKENLKQALKELMKEDPVFFEELVAEYLRMKPEEEISRFKELTAKNFKRFEEAFKALA